MRFILGTTQPLGKLECHTNVAFMLDQGRSKLCQGDLPQENQTNMFDLRTPGWPDKTYSFDPATADLIS
jgi:hypothetical protein